MCSFALSLSYGQIHSSSSCGIEANDVTGHSQFEKHS